MAEFADNQQDIVRRKIKELSRDSRKEAESPDSQELKEREEAAKRYAGENPKHFVDYGNDCVATYCRAMIKVRQEQKECWECFNEDAPPNYTQKEDWQSKVVIPKPYASVMFAMAVVKKAFSVDFLSVQNEQNIQVAAFWEKLMQHCFNQKHADFTTAFTDSTGMGFAVGQSLEVLPVWRRGEGLKFILVEPWKIHRDPDAISRNPQSGLYWIHREYIDYYALKEKEKLGVYQNIDDVKGYLDISHGGMSKEEIAERKGLYWQRSKFRTAILTSEFWGQVLGPDGTVILPSARYTWAGNQIIQPPQVPPYRSLRWPGSSFSPLPNFIRFDGRSLLKSVKSLWHWMCTVFSLHSDNLNWVVNPPKEIDVSSLVDPDDLDDYPGKVTLTRGTVSGNQVIRTIERKNTTNEILANLNYGDQVFQRGAMVTDLVQGLPGWRAEVTAREQAQNLEQAMSVFSLMGSNIEKGAIAIVEAAAQIIEANIGYFDLLEIFTPEEIEPYIDLNSPTGIRLPGLGGSFHVSGISAIMKDSEILNSIKELILPLYTEGSPFVKYIHPYRVLKSIERRSNLEDEKLFISDIDGEVLDEETMSDAKEKEDLELEERRASAEIAAANAAQSDVGMEAPVEEV
jgi:hypothetical protein